MFSKMMTKHQFWSNEMFKLWKEIGKEEQLTLKVKAKDLKGYTHLASWADAQYKLCEDCAQ